LGDPSGTLVPLLLGPAVNSKTNDCWLLIFPFLFTPITIGGREKGKIPIPKGNYRIGELTGSSQINSSYLSLLSQTLYSIPISWIIAFGFPLGPVPFGTGSRTRE